MSKIDNRAQIIEIILLWASSSICISTWNHIPRISLLFLLLIFVADFSNAENMTLHLVPLLFTHSATVSKVLTKYEAVWRCWGYNSGPNRLGFCLKGTYIWGGRHSSKSIKSEQPSCECPKGGCEHIKCRTDMSSGYWTPIKGAVIVMM